MSVEKSAILGALDLLERFLANPDIIPGNTVADWNSGTATSGQPGADLVTIGTVGEWSELSDAVLRLDSFTPGATITVRAYKTIAGAEEEIMNEDYVVGVDPNLVLFVWWLVVRMYSQVRVEVHSDQAGDDGAAAIFEYYIKSLEYV